MKILITISGGFVARNILRTGVLERLLSGGMDVVLLCPNDRVVYYQKEFGGPRVSVAGIEPLYEGKTEKIVRFFAKNCLRTEIIVYNQKEHLFSSRTPRAAVIFLIKQIVGFLGYVPGVVGLIRFADRFVAEKKEIAKIVQNEKPDIVFATNVIDDMDIAVLREARRLGIKTIGMVKSWDNLTGHGIVRIVPDIVVVHSPWLHGLAKKLHRIPDKKLQMVGVPQYDYFFRKEFLTPREEFLRSLGIAADARLLVFAAIGDDFAPFEWEMPRIMNDMIERGELSPNCMVIARPHPNFGITKGLEPHGKYIYIDTPARYIGQTVFTWEMEKGDMDHFANILYHADVVITGASTITMDAAVLDRPIVNYAFDGTHTLPYYRSVRRCYERYTHYIAMVKTGGFATVYSQKELAEVIKKYLENPARHREGRQRIIREFVHYTDGKSAERLANVLLEK